MEEQLIFQGKGMYLLFNLEVVKKNHQQKLCDSTLFVCKTKICKKKQKVQKTIPEPIQGTKVPLFRIWAEKNIYEQND